MAVDVITSRDEVTPEWLTSVLMRSGALEEGVVSGFEFADSLDRELSASGRIKVSYEPGSRGELPAALFLKLVDTRYNFLKLTDLLSGELAVRVGNGKMREKSIEAKPFELYDPSKQTIDLRGQDTCPSHPGIDFDVNLGGRVFRRRVIRHFLGEAVRRNCRNESTIHNRRNFFCHRNPVPADHRYK